MLCERKTLRKDNSTRSIEQFVKGCMIVRFPSAGIRTAIESYFQKCKPMKSQAICTKCSTFQLDRTIQFCHVEFSATNCSTQIVAEYQYIVELQRFAECCKSVGEFLESLFSSQGMTKRPSPVYIAYDRTTCRITSLNASAFSAFFSLFGLILLQFQ